MQVSVEKTSELSRKMTVRLPEEQIQEKMEARFNSLAREIRLDGFRPGKAPQQVIKKLYGERVRSEVTGDLIASSYYAALQEQQLHPVSQPHIHPAENNSEPGFTYVAHFEVYPEITLDGLAHLEIGQPRAEIEESDVDAMIEQIRTQKKTWIKVDRGSQQGDRITIDFSGVAEGENFTNGKVENYPVEIGSGQMIPGFEDNLSGLQAGETKTFGLTFPETYGNEKLAGKPAQFEIAVTNIEEPKLPEINDEFIKAYGIENGNLETFRHDVKENMRRELSQALQTRQKNYVLEALYNNIPVTLPSVMIDAEIDSLMQPYRESARKRNIKLEEIDLPRDHFEAQAKRRVALGLILSDIIQKNAIKLDDHRVRTAIEDMSQSYERPEDVINWYYADNSRLNDVRQMILENQAVDWVLGQAKTHEEHLTFNEVMNQNR